MEKYSIQNNCYITEDGFVFKNKVTGNLVKGIHISKFTRIDDYEIIPEPVPEPIPEEAEQEETNG